MPNFFTIRRRCSRNGLPLISTMTLGIWYVTGRSRVPFPPARMAHWIIGLIPFLQLNPYCAHRHIHPYRPESAQIPGPLDGETVSPQ